MSTTGSRAGSSHRWTRGERRNAPCSPVTPGSWTATTSKRSNFGSNVRTPWCFLRHLGGGARVGRSCEGSGSQLAIYPKVARIQPGDACAMNGDWFGSSGVIAVPNLNADAQSLLSTGDTQPCTCSVQTEQPGSFSTAWATTNYDIWDRIAELSVETIADLHFRARPFLSRTPYHLRPPGLSYPLKRTTGNRVKDRVGSG